MPYDPQASRARGETSDGREMTKMMGEDVCATGRYRAVGRIPLTLGLGNLSRITLDGQQTPPTPRTPRITLD